MVHLVHLGGHHSSLLWGEVGYAVVKRFGKEMVTMPWYMNPVRTSKVLNRIANRHKRTSLQDLRVILDQATQLIWTKQENYYQNIR